jgi:hypothetical protein
MPHNTPPNPRLASLLALVLLLGALIACNKYSSGLSNSNVSIANLNANVSRIPIATVTPQVTPTPSVSFPRRRRPTQVQVHTSLSDAKETGWRAAQFTADAASDATNRYPTIESPDQVPVSQEFAVQVSLTTELTSPDVKVVSGATSRDPKQFAFRLPAQTSWPIGVVLSAPDFEILGGKNQDTLILPSGGDAPPVVFQLRPKPISTEQQPGRLFVTFYFNGTFLGRAMREVTITNGNSSAREEIQSKPAPAADGGGARKLTRQDNEEQLQVGRLSAVPDLTIYVRDYPGMNQNGTSEIQISSPTIPLNVSSFPKPSGLEAWLNSKYREFARLGSRGTTVVSDTEEQVDKESAALLLRGFGRELYQKFAPPAFKEAFWKLVDESNAAGATSEFRSIQIYSDNPILPWELMRPVRADGSDERGFLGMEFKVGRWHVSEGAPLMDKPPQRVSIASLYLVAPDYRGSQVLPGQQEEIAALSAFRGYQRVPGQFHALAALLTRSPSGIIHFAGHGVIRTREESVPEYFILLEDGELDPSRWRGIVTAKTSLHQFVFFNACDVGQVSRVANFVNGWAPAVLETGASGYIGALWPLGDKAAANFAIHFYRALEQRAGKGSVSVADVLRDTRRLFLEENDPTYLAYVYYGDPNLRLDVR